MDVSALSDLPWRQAVKIVLVLLGLIVFWHGLWGGRNGQRGLLRPRAGTLQRIEGWRRVIIGLALVGFGAAWLWESALLFYLTVAIGFVEGSEASAVIAVMRRERRRAPAKRVTPRAGRAVHG
jgi:hypothetical protein